MKCSDIMYSKELEELIDAAIADGVISGAERRVLHRRAESEGVDLEELDVLIDGRLAKIKRQDALLQMARGNVSLNKEADNVGDKDNGVDSASIADKPRSANRKVQYGNVLVCPSCGESVVGGTAVCHACGYTFSNVQVCTSGEALTKKLESFNKRQENRVDKSSLGFWDMMNPNRILSVYKSKMDIVSTHPVLNTRADLLELLTMIRSRAKSTGSRRGMTVSGYEDLSYGYWLLYTNCINKAKLNFRTDPDFQPYFAHYDEELSKTRGFIGFLRCNPTTRLVLILVIVWCVLVAFVVIGATSLH